MPQIPPPSGAGKTRLAVEFAATVVDRFRDGVWLADLAGVSDPDLVAVQVMEVLGVRQAGGVPVLEALAYRLRSAELLLVLDNCEHLPLPPPRNGRPLGTARDSPVFGGPVLRSVRRRR